MKKKGQPPVTAAEVMERLGGSEEFRKREKARVLEQEAHRRSYDEAARILLQELQRTGHDVDTVGDLLTGRRPYGDVVPILVHWLRLSGNTPLKEDIIRTLSVPWAKEALPALMEEFERAGPGQPNLRWAIANSIEILADESTFEWLTKILPRREYGSGRQMLVLSLAKAGHREAAIPLLLSLLDDDTVAGHALKAMNRMKARVPQAAIRRFEKHKNAWVRREATRLLSKAS